VVWTMPSPCRSRLRVRWVIMASTPPCRCEQRRVWLGVGS